MTNMSNNTTNPSHELCETTAAMAQAEAMSPVIASEIGQHAVEERNAARDAAQHAREMGRKLTGDFEGDADRDKVKHSLASTSIKLDQNYGPDTSKNGPQDPGNRVMSSAQGTASTVDKKSGEALHHAEDTVSQSLSKGTPTTNTGNNTEQGKGYLQTMTDTANVMTNKPAEMLHSAVETAQEYLGFGAPAQHGPATDSTPAGRN